MAYENDRDELSSILTINNAYRILEYEERILELVPELIVCNKWEWRNEYKGDMENLYVNTLHVVIFVYNDLTLNLAALFHNIGKPYVMKKTNEKTHYCGYEEISATIARLVLNRLNYDEGIINDVCTIIKKQNEKINPTINDIKLVVDSIGKINFERLLELQIHTILVHKDEDYKKRISKLYKLKEVYINNEFI